MSTRKPAPNMAMWKQRTTRDRKFVDYRDKDEDDFDDDDDEMPPRRVGRSSKPKTRNESPDVVKTPPPSSRRVGRPPSANSKFKSPVAVKTPPPPPPRRIGRPSKPKNESKSPVVVETPPPPPRRIGRPSKSEPRNKSPIVIKTPPPPPPKKPQQMKKPVKAKPVVAKKPNVREEDEDEDISDTDEEMPEEGEKIARVVFSEDEEAEQMSHVIHSSSSVCVEPSEYPKLQDLWQSIVKDMSVEFVNRYFEVVKKMLLGRISSLQPIYSEVPEFPKDMLRVHDEFFRLISEMSGVYPYHYHNGSKLISKHFVGGVAEIGAVSLLCCLLRGVMPLDLNKNMPAITRISTIVRTEIKDALEEACKKLDEEEKREKGSSSAPEKKRRTLTRSCVKIPKVNI